jgi:uncharacterized protein (TIGR03435 family)
MVNPRRVAFAVLASIVAGQSGASSAQTPGSPAFEVASVKPNRSDTGQRMDMGSVPDRVSLMGATVGQLINVAYNVALARITGGPQWLSTDRFDVIARADMPVSVAQKQLMLRTLLADRFKLAIHMEPRTETTFTLVMLKQGQLGPNLHTASLDCATLRATAQANDRDPCGAVALSRAQMTGQMKVRGYSIDELAGILARDVGTPVVNKTGLAGVFDWELTYTPQAFLQRSFDRERFPSINPDGPSIFTAVSDQLGLKLDRANGNVDFLVIDHLEHPTPD